MAAQAPLIGELRARHERGETNSLLCTCHDPARCYRSLLATLILGKLGDGLQGKLEFSELLKMNIYYQHHHVGL